jgi:hypothetical protein
MEGSLGVIYSNILLHEIFWHGILREKSEDGAKGTLGCGDYPIFHDVLDLSASANAINAKFN